MAFSEVLVVDDGSHDGTAQIASAAGASVVRLSPNQGYDLALRAGLHEALKTRPSAIVTCDADGQHSAEDVKRAFDALLSGHAQVVGNRGVSARWAEKLFGIHAKKRHGIVDPMCGLKGYSISTLDQVSPSRIVGTIGAGIAIDVSRLGVLVLNMDIEPRVRSTSESRFGNGFRSNLPILVALLRCSVADAALMVRALLRKI
jgi:glycosyltransferase involved in cell wall biosynthesis